MPRRSARPSPFDDLDSPSEVVAPEVTAGSAPGRPAPGRAAPRGRFEEPPGLAWRLAGLPVAFAGLFVFVALASYHASDVPFLAAPQQHVLHNWTGLAGATVGWFLFQVFGLPAFAVAPALFIAGIAMSLGRRLGWKPLWAAALLPPVCSLFQRANAVFAPMLSSPRYNLGGDAGGGVGWLLHHPGSVAERWIGPAGDTALTVALALVFLVLFADPRALAARFRAAARRREEIRHAAEERAFGGTSAVEDDEDRLAAERRAAKDAAKAEKEAERERRRAEREAEEAERAAAKERLRAAREAEHAAEKERREAEKRRREAEKAEARAKREEKRRSRDERLFGGDDAGEPPAEPEEASGPAVPAPAAEGRADPPVPAPAQPVPAPAASLSQGLLEPRPEVDPEPPASDPMAWESNPAAGDFELPSVRLLKPLPAETAEDNRAEIEERSRVIEDTLGQFGLKVEVVDVVCGPTITRYEVRPAPGVRVDRISTFEHDLQMSLRAKSIRIISPIPGKDVLGIEVPNRHRRAVPFRGIAESPEWKAAEQRMGIPMLLGKDIDGSPVIADLAKMPHLIVAGATGSGKSVGLNSILSGILLCRTPEQVRMILVDPKMVEFTPYADIPHLVVPVITEAPKVAVALQWAIKEMNRRLQLFKTVGVRNIVSYNTRPLERQASLFGDEDGTGAAAPAPPAHIPYIVIVVDEMSDLMMLAGGDIEPRVVRLAQLARAVGIHLVIATQRPDVKTITGKIKANFPARLAFKVVSQVDSITILNSAGAETLIGNGDMLFMNPTSAAGAARAQGCWIDDEEIATLTGWYRNQGPPVYVPEIKEKLDRIKVKDSGGDDIKGIEDPGAQEDDGAPRTGEEADLARALAVIVSSGRATISWVQRQLKVGYNRAARIIEELEERGCIGPANGTAPREILRTTLGPPPGEGDGGGDDGGEGDDDGDFV